MAEPIVFISHSRIKEGKLGEFREHLRRNLPGMEAEKPRTLVMAAYLNDEGTMVSIVHLFADAASMDVHMEGVEERARAAFEFIETARFEIYGNPSDAVLRMMRQAAEGGVEVTVRSDVVGGFLRLAAG